MRFEVIGVPKPQGSKKPFKDRAGNARMAESGGLAFAAWRNAVSEAARRAHGDAEPLDGPLVLAVEFRFPMPKSAPKRDHEQGRRWKTTAPDTDKLVRSIGDALEAAGVITSDARIAKLRDIDRVEVTGWTGAVIDIERLT